jgi:hypothetical protein
LTYRGILYQEEILWGDRVSGIKSEFKFFPLRCDFNAISTT